MSEDPQTTIANSFWNKINSKSTPIGKGWRGSRSFPKYPSLALNATPALGGGNAHGAAMARPLLSGLKTFYVRSLPAKLDSLLFWNLPGYTWTWFSVSQVAIWLSFDLNRNPARAKGIQVVSETASITCSASWGLEREKLLWGYKGLKAWSRVSNVKIKACWGRPDNVISGKLQHRFKISCWFSSISQTSINCCCKFWKCWKTCASFPLQGFEVLIGAFLGVHSKKIHPTFLFLPPWRSKKHSFDKQKQEWRVWGRISERRKDEKDKRNPKGRSIILKMVADGEKRSFLKRKMKK